MAVLKWCKVKPSCNSNSHDDLSASHHQLMAQLMQFYASKWQISNTIEAALACPQLWCSCIPLSSLPPIQFLLSCYVRLNHCQICFQRCPDCSMLWPYWCSSNLWLSIDTLDGPSFAFNIQSCEKKNPKSITIHKKVIQILLDFKWGKYNLRCTITRHITSC